MAQPSAPKPSAPKASAPKASAPSGGQAANATLSDAGRRKAGDSLARAEANKSNLGTRASNLPSSLGEPGQGSPNGGYNKAANVNNGGNTPLNKQRSAAKENGNRKMQDLKRQMEMEVIKKAAAAHGIPEPVTDKLLKTNKGQKLMDMIERKADPNPFRKGLPFSKKKKEMEKKEENGEEESPGEAVAKATFKATLTMIRVAIFAGPLGSLILIFLVLIVATLSDEKASSMILAGMSADESSAIRQEVGTGNGADTGKGNAYPEEYYERINNLGNLYSSQKACEGEDCLSTPEFMYYLKIADIKVRYEKKYNVTLDWYLISATNLYSSKGTEETMQANLGGYERASVDNTSTVSGLDWDNDYKNINGYLYLDADDSTYDLQILAKNMVTKKTEQKCTDSSGNTVKSQEDIDVEDIYLQSTKKLQCDSGQTYSINSTYTRDDNKFKEFMLEYIDLKFYEKGSGSSGNGGTMCNVVSGNGYLWPIGSVETTTGQNGKTFAIGTPEVGKANISRGFGPNGHQGLDIHSNGRTNVVNIIATRSGTVVHPSDKSQTGFADVGNSSDGGGYGNYVKIKHDDGTYALYGHLAQNSITVFAGERVEAGQVIAKMGHSGDSTGPHLHFEIRDTSDVRQDPMKYVDPENPRPEISETCNTNSQNSMAAAMISLAVSQIDEPEAKNGKKYWSWFGSNTRFEWCAAFVSWVVANTEYDGKKLSDTINYKSASTGMWINHFNNSDNLKYVHNDNCSKLAGLNGGDSKYTPKAGDIIFFDWDGDWKGKVPTEIGPADHIAIVQKTENGKIVTIEGNSDNKVAERRYPLDSCEVIGFGSWY